MIKNFETYISEKFDYTKQKHYKRIDDLEIGDSYYELLTTGIIKTFHVKEIKDKNDEIIIIRKEPSLPIHFHKEFFYECMGVEWIGNGFAFIVSTDIYVLKDFLNSKYYTKFKEKYNNGPCSSEKDAYEAIYNFMKNN